MKLKKGIITKGIGGFYYVLDDDKETIECKGRGILKNKEDILMVGDVVTFEKLGDNKGIINSIEKRKNQFIRPPVSNIDMFVIVISATVPKANPLLIDKFLIMGEHYGIETLICINKVDEENMDSVSEIRSIYENVSDVVEISCKKNKGIKELKNLMKGKKVALAGTSGVGKSTITSVLTKNDEIEVGKLSEKTKKGKHTTRHVEIFQIEDDIMIYDTPGFSSFDLGQIDKDELKIYYTDIFLSSQNCKYRSCNHINEPECNVISDVKLGKIHSTRYDSYIFNRNELIKKENMKYKN